MLISLKELGKEINPFPDMGKEKGAGSFEAILKPVKGRTPKSCDHSYRNILCVKLCF